MDIRRARAGFDVLALTWLIGDPVVGADVALVTADGSGRALTAGPLAAEGGPVARWSALVVEALGWDRHESVHVPTMGGDRRLAVGSIPSTEPTALRELVRAQPAGALLRRILSTFVAAYVLAVVAVLLVPFPQSLIALVVVLGGGILLAKRQQVPMRAAVRAAAPDLERREVVAASSLLIALGGAPSAPADGGPLLGASNPPTLPMPSAPPDPSIPPVGPGVPASMAPPPPPAGAPPVPPASGPGRAF